MAISIHRVAITLILLRDEFSEHVILITNDCAEWRIELNNKALPSMHFVR